MECAKKKPVWPKYVRLNVVNIYIKYLLFACVIAACMYFKVVEDSIHTVLFNRNGFLFYLIKFT
ncbi:hypothetical protein X975_22746, partial [Stegodyphus mimosarum]